MLRWPTKDPGEKLDYSIDFSDRLNASDSISAVTWTVPVGLTLVSQSNTSTIATVILSGGTLGVQYEVTAQATTTLGFILKQSVIEKIRTRVQGAMTITVEDGTGLSAANSYASEATADTYFIDRDVSDWHNYTGANDKEAALVRATAAVDAMFRGQWPGYKKLSRDQALEWPRSYAFDQEGVQIDSDSVPREVVQATCEGALQELLDPGCLTPSLDRGGDIRRLKAGSVEIEYGANAASRTIYTIIGSLLSGILLPGANNPYQGTTNRA